MRSLRGLPLLGPDYSLKEAEVAFIGAQLLVAFVLYERISHKEVTSSYPDIQEGMLFADFSQPRSIEAAAIPPPTLLPAPTSPPGEAQAFPGQGPASGKLTPGSESPGHGIDGLKLLSGESNDGWDSDDDAEGSMEIDEEIATDGPHPPENGLCTMQKFKEKYFPAFVVGSGPYGVELEWAGCVLEGPDTPKPTSKFVISLTTFLRCESMAKNGDTHPSEVRCATILS